MRLFPRLRRRRPAPPESERLLRVYRQTSADVEALVRREPQARPKRAA